MGEQDVFHAFPLGERRAALRQLIGLARALGGGPGGASGGLFIVVGTDPARNSPQHVPQGKG